MEGHQVHSASSSTAAPSVPSGAVAVAARAAAAAKAVAAAKAAAGSAPTTSAKASAGPPAVRPVPATRGGDQQDHDGGSRPSSSAAASIQQPPAATTTAKDLAPRAPSPQVFSMAADEDDDESVEGGATTTASPSHWPPPLAIDAEPKAKRGPGPDLSPEEEKDYEQIEAQFQLFKARQSEVERNVAQLLDRLNTRLHIPSSIASSECGDMTSMASSEWDTESLCPTEDGLSVFESRIGSRAGTPPLVGSPTGSPRQDHLTPLQRMAASSGGLKPWHMPPAMDSRTPQKPTFGSAIGTASGSSGMFVPSERVRASDGTAAEGGERGDLSGRQGAVRSKSNTSARKDLSPAVEPEKRHPELSQSPPRYTPRLTQQLLEQASRAVGMEGKETSPPTSDMRWSSPPPHKDPDKSPLAPQPDAEDGPADGDTRLPQFGVSAMNEAAGADGTLEDEEELQRWKGWTVVATQEGRLFFPQ
mmetsp:Transcript_74977/g.145077  ORF Transcript_74977/g.145077 Transcript_74977/m.145077 type:complete len:474 (-) Transcript_74977:9-1430(-)